MQVGRTLVHWLWRLVGSPSTLALWKEGRRTPGFSVYDWLHGYFYGRFTYFYIGFGTGRHFLARRLGRPIGRLVRFALVAGSVLSLPRRRPQRSHKRRISFADTYHGKVLPLQAATQLVTVQEDIHLPDLEKVIPYALARDLILKNPTSIVALECPCRAARPNPCLPLDVCLIVGEPFASFVLEHHPRRTRPITQQEAVEILQAEDARGHVHHAFFKDAMLGRFYAICNCCSCCCGAMDMQRRGTPMLASSGYLAEVDPDLCIGCEGCVEYCQFGALNLAGFQIQVDEAACMGCGVCVSKCDQAALSLRRTPEKGEPLEICELLGASK